MKTHEQIREEFIAKLKNLLSEYGEDATLECDDYYPGYAECGRDVHMTLYIPSIWDNEGNEIQPHGDIDIGDYIMQDGN